MNKFINRQIIKNVSSFNSEIEAIVIEESKRKYFLLYKNTKYSMPDDISTIRSFKSSLLLGTYNAVCYQLKTGVLTLVSNLDILISTIMNNKLVISCTEDSSTYRTYYNLYDLETSQLVLSKNIPYNLYIEGDVIIAYDNFKGELKRIHTDTYSVWEFPLEQLGELPYSPGKIDTIEKILGVVHGNLWFYTRAGILVALDIETGEKTFTRDCFGPYLDKKTQNIILLSGNIFTIVDTKALKIKERYNFLEIDPTGIGSYESIFKPFLQGDYFTFIGKKENEIDGYGCGWAGVFDYKARKLVWEYEIITQEERKKTGNELITPQQLFLSNNKLYIKDFHKNLHIFEVDL